MSSWENLFDDAEVTDTEFKSIPEGKYTAVVSNTEIDETKDPTTVYIEYQLMSSDFTGRKVRNYTRMADKGPYFLKKDLMAMGITEPTSGKVPELLESIVGKSVEVFIKPREYNGKTYYNAYCNGLLDTSIPSVDIDEDIGF